MENGFSIEIRHPEIVIQTFGSNKDERGSLVKFHQTSSLFAILIGRLYYRHQALTKLGSRLAEPNYQESIMNDAALALNVYRKLGIDGIEHLEGDFAFVIWDGTARQLIGSRDPMGGYPLFWTEHKKIITLSTSIFALLNRLPHKSIDLEYLADYLMAAAPMNELASDRSVYDGICRIMPGQIIIVQVPGGQIKQYSYWNWQERLTEPTSHQINDVSEQYADLLRCAVRERINGKTASHFSGGMDSTAVSLIASRLIASGIGAAPLHTISLVYGKLHELARETPYIESALNEQENIVEHRIPADDLLDFDSFSDPPVHDEPCVGLWRWALDQATIEIAAGLGVNTLLTGIGADELLDIQPFYLTDLLKQGRIYRAWKEATRWAKADNCSPWEILYSFGIANLFPGLTRGGAFQALLSRDPVKMVRQNEGTIPAWIEPTFAQRYKLRQRAIRKTHQTYKACQSTTLSLALHAIETRTGDVNRWHLAAPYEIAIGHPFLDARILSLGLGIQDKIKIEPGKMKPVLAESMRSILPDKIRTRRRKGHFNEVYYLGLSKNLNILEELIKDAPLEDLGIIKKDVLIPCLHQAALGAAGVRSSQRLNLTLSFIKWFSMQDRWRNNQIIPRKTVRLNLENNL